MLISLEFAGFVLAILLIHNLLSSRRQNILLLTASYVAYAYWDWRFLALLWLATTVTFWISHKFAESNTPRRYLMGGIAFNLGILVIFKYAGFFITSAILLLNRIDPFASAKVLDIVLPLGLSFYTFRLLSYLLDSYNRRIEPASLSWVNFALYVAFFPQIVAGPIERVTRFLPQLQQTRRLTQQQALESLAYVFVGLYYKVAIADPLVSAITATYSNVAAATPAEALKAIILYSVYIYADFAGYSAIAIGISRLFLLPAMDNFRQPYFSKSVIEFWTRWHISLSSWFRDYLFYPMSRALLKRWGNRYILAIQCACYLITMLVTGLWHGANWTFIVWGLLFGIYMSVETILARFGEAPGSVRWQKWLNIMVNVLITQAAVTLAWVFFRSDTVADALQILQKAISMTSMPEASWWVAILTPLLLLITIDLAQLYAKDTAVLWKIGLMPRAVLCAFMILALFIFWGEASAPFIYLRF